MVVWFDMNNVICDFYKVEDVYARLDNGDNRVYLEANVIPKGIALMNTYKEAGYSIGIITRLSKKMRSEKIDMETYINKYNWLVHNGINVDVFKLIPYEDNKWDYRESDDDIIVDDDERVWRDWGNSNIVRIIKEDKMEVVTNEGSVVRYTYYNVLDKHVVSVASPTHDGGYSLFMVRRACKTLEEALDCFWATVEELEIMASL
jgi:hypothetical protein